MMHLGRVGRRLALGAALGAVTAGGAMAQSSLSGAYLAGLQAAKRGDVEMAAEYLSRALDRDPGDLALMEQTLVYLAAAGRIEASLDLAERLSVFDAKHRMANLLLVAAELKRGENAAARARIAAAPEAFHPLVGALLSGWAAQGEGDEEAADAAFSALDGRSIFRVFTAYHSGLMRHAAGDPAGAVKAFAKLAEELTAPSGRMARAYAAALIDAGKPDEAREMLEAAASLAVGDSALEADLDVLDAGGAAPGPLVSTSAQGAAETLFGLAAALGRDGDERLSLVYARLANWLRPDLIEATLLTAEILDAGGQDAAAVRAYESIPPDSPLARSAEIGRAEALYRMDRTDEAAEALKALARREPGAIDAQVALGDHMRRTERFREAAVAYDAAVRLMDAEGRPSWALYYQRGIARERSGAWEDAEADFFKALEMQPDQPLILNYLGYSWLEKGLHIDRAMGMIRKAVEQRPDDGYIVDSLGWGHYLLEEYPEAVKELEQAVELLPVDPVINDHFGDALWQVGRRLEAEFQWRRALSFEPTEKDRARIRAKLDVGLDRVLANETSAAPGETPAKSANGG